MSDWYLDARQTTFDGVGAVLVGAAMLDVLDPAATGVGGMTMGADPITMATVMTASARGRALRGFSIRKAEKGHGTGGRVVGPVAAGDRVAILEDTTTTGGAAFEAADCAVGAGLVVIQAISLVDRSAGAARRGFEERVIPYVALVTPEDLGVGP
jgi:orotate phosphoribosyltransferase